MWNFNHKSQKRPLQLNIFPLYKELIKVMSRQWTKLSSTESEQDLLKRGKAERLLGIRWNCSAPCQQFKNSPQHSPAVQPNQLLEVLLQVTLPFLGGSAPNIFPAAGEKRAGQLEMSSICQGRGSWSFSEWTSLQQRASSLRQMRSWQRFPCWRVIPPAELCACVCVHAPAFVSLWHRTGTVLRVFLLNQFLNSDFRINS